MNRRTFIKSTLAAATAASLGSCLPASSNYDLGPSSWRNAHVVIYPDGVKTEIPVQAYRGTTYVTRPEKCRVYLKPHDPETWDPITEEYPPNHEWEECMGVGRK